MIGPDLPAHLTANRSATPDDDGDEAGPSQPPGPVIGPAIPPEVLQAKPVPAPDEDEDDEDDYTPALPPDMDPAYRQSQPSAPSTSAKRVQGPSFPPSLTRPSYGNDDDSDDDVGPMPLPAGYYYKEKDGVTEFLEKEERRRKQVEEASKPKKPQREEWMLVPPSASDLLGSIDPTKLTKGRQFSRSAAPSKDVDNSLWTETPAERQQRLADEVSGKRRRAVNADPDTLDEGKALEMRKRARHDEQVRKGVDEYTRKNRGDALLQQHASKSKDDKKGEDEGPPAIWDHSRDMALSGRLMDDKSRDKLIKDARGLSDRFGTGKSGGFL